MYNLKNNLYIIFNKKLVLKRILKKISIIIVIDKIRRHFSMKTKYFLAIILLSALWGFSFLFMKISSPEMGAIFTTNLRVLISAITLIIVCFLNKDKISFLKMWKEYFILGLLNAALPFALICTAELHITASLAAILNATTPTFTAIVSVIWSKEHLNIKKVLGLILGFLGVIVLVGLTSTHVKNIWIYALLSILAAFSYGFVGVYSSLKVSKNVPPLNLALGQQLAATIILLPFSILTLPKQVPSSKAIISVILLGILCTSIAYLIYFYLIKQVGAVKTLSVTFLVPAFGIIWAALFLREKITIQNVIGLIIIILSIVLINNRIPYKKKIQALRNKAV